MTKVRQPLNLRAYQLFEAVARHRSLTSAAGELGITQSAVSHQLRALADRLGHELIVRRGRTIVLTDAGSALARTLGRAFDILEERDGSAPPVRPIIRLGVYSSFAIPWLVAQLPDFYAQHPGIDLRLVMLDDPHEVTVRVADVFVTSEHERPGYWSVRLAQERLVPVGHPAGPAGFDRRMRLISSEAEPGIAGRLWQAFATLNGIDLDVVAPDGWHCCSHYVIAAEMALAGLGAALLPDFMVAGHIAAGRLVRLPGQALPTGQTYDIQTLFTRRLDRSVLAVNAWLQRIVARDMLPG